jgi:hypothetical protein
VACAKAGGVANPTASPNAAMATMTSKSPRANHRAFSKKKSIARERSCALSVLDYALPGQPSLFGAEGKILLRNPDGLAAISDRAKQGTKHVSLLTRWLGLPLTRA